MSFLLRSIVFFISLARVLPVDARTGLRHVCSAFIVCASCVRAFRFFLLSPHPVLHDSYADWDLAAKHGLDVFLRRELIGWSDDQVKLAQSAKDGTAVSLEGGRRIQTLISRWLVSPLWCSL